MIIWESPTLHCHLEYSKQEDRYSQLASFLSTSCLAAASSFRSTQLLTDNEGQDVEPLQLAWCLNLELSLDLIYCVLWDQATNSLVQISCV